MVNLDELSWSLGSVGKLADGVGRGYNSIKATRLTNARNIPNPSTNRICRRETVWMGGRGGGDGGVVIGVSLFFLFLCFDFFLIEGHFKAMRQVS